MTHEIGDNDDCYANSRIDAAVVEALAGSESASRELGTIIENALHGGEVHGDTGEPFRMRAYTNIMRWLRTAHRIAGDPDPGIAAIAETARSTARLAALSERAADRAATPEDLSDIRGFVEFLTGDWFAVNSTLATKLDETLRYVGAMNVTVTSRDRTRMSRIGERTGSWNLWDPESLPAEASAAALEAIEEFRVGSRAKPPAPDAEEAERAERFKPLRVEPVTLDVLRAEARTGGHERPLRLDGPLDELRADSPATSPTLEPPALGPLFDEFARLDPAIAATRPAPDLPPTTDEAYELATTCIATIELAARSMKLARHALKKGIICRDESGGSMSGRREQLRFRALTAASELETAAATLQRDLCRIHAGC